MGLVVPWFGYILQFYLITHNCLNCGFQELSAVEIFSGRSTVVKGFRCRQRLSYLGKLLEGDGLEAQKKQ